MKSKSTGRKVWALVLALFMAAAIIAAMGLTQKTYAEDGVEINDTNFPDPIFRKYVSNNFDKENRDEFLSSSEISKATGISLSNNGIDKYGKVSNLKGIEYLTSLKTLYCDRIPITSLDVSRNTALENLTCRGTRNLTSLDVSNNTALKDLRCLTTPLITSLDVSNNTALETLMLANTPITSLDLSKNTALTTLNCSGTELTSLDLSQHSSLDTVYCNRNKLTSLNASQCPKLRYLQCDVNKLTSLDVSQCTSLVSLDCTQNLLTSLDVSQCPALGGLFCNENKLTSLDVSQNHDLAGLYCNNNQLTNLDMSHCPKLDWLECQGNQLTSLEVSQCDVLRVLHCEGNQLTSLDLGKKTKLEELYCNNNRLTNLDVSECPYLKDLHCDNNQLTELDVSNNIGLYGLFCNNNQLTSLDLSANPYILDESETMAINSQSRAVHATCRSGKAVVDLASDLDLDMSRVSDVAVTGGTYSDGKASFDFPLASGAEITYNYNTKRNDKKMDVTLSVNGVEHPWVHHDRVDPTCTEKGREGYWICSSCGRSYSDEAGTVEVTDLSMLDIPALGHDFEETVTAPTCTEKGYTTYTCRRCGYTYKGEETAALGHDFSTDWSSDSTGHWHVCRRCGIKSVVKAHKFGPWKHTGSHTHECTVCGYKETEECTFGAWKITKQPTATEKGEKMRTCTKCGYVEKSEIAKVARTSGAAAAVTTAKPGPESPKTGDSSHVILWIVLLLAAAGAGILIIRRRVRRERD